MNEQAEITENALLTFRVNLLEDELKRLRIELDQTLHQRDTLVDTISKLYDYDESGRAKI